MNEDCQAQPLHISSCRDPMHGAFWCHVSGSTNTANTVNKKDNAPRQDPATAGWSAATGSTPKLDANKGKQPACGRLSQRVAPDAVLLPDLRGGAGACAAVVRRLHPGPGSPRRPPPRSARTRWRAASEPPAGRTLPHSGYQPTAPFLRGGGRKVAGSMAAVGASSVPCSGVSLP